MALQQHLLDARCESKVTLEREGAVSETGFAAFGLVTVGVEGVFQAETFSKGSQGLCRTFAVECPGLHIGKPTVRIACPVVRPHFVEPLQGGPYDVL